MSSASADPRLAAALPRYEIRRELGRGGWGVVYEGWHRDLERAVAIKQLSTAIGADDQVRARFIAEAQLVAGLQHPHIVPVFDFAEHDGLYVIVMELAAGGSLWDRFRDQGLRAEEAIAVVLAASVGLHHAHQRGLVHRDVKPDNILFSADGVVKVADFGIAKTLSETTGARTATGSIVGTPSYMAPEQVLGEPVIASTDVYALAIMTYELLSGQMPFSPKTDAVAALFQHVHEPPRPLTDTMPDAHPAIADVLARSLAKDPAERPASAEAFAAELAAAATLAYGTGWLARSGIDVMGATSVIAATERTATGAGLANAAPVTEVIQPTQAAHLRLGDPPDAGLAATMAETPDQPAISAPGTEQLFTAGASAESPASPATPAPPGESPVSASRSNRMLAAAAVAVLLVVGVIGALVLATGGDGDEPTGVDTSDSSPISATERTTFMDMCLASDVTESRCGCALDRAGGLDPAEFREGLATLLARDGGLTPELIEIFDGCVADGF